MRFLFLCFLIVPIVEMLVLLKVGAFIGAFYTVLLVLMTAVIGVSLLKRQGLSTFIRANQKMQTGQMPVAEMGEGLMLAVAGALLLTPGFVTDGIGFLLLTPGVRSLIANKWLVSMLKNASERGQSSAVYSQTTHTYSQQSSDIQPIEDADIVEGEFQEVDISSDNKER